MIKLRLGVFICLNMVFIERLNLNSLKNCHLNSWESLDSFKIDFSTAVMPKVSIFKKVSIKSLDLESLKILMKSQQFKNWLITVKKVSILIAFDCRDPQP